MRANKHSVPMPFRHPGSKAHLIVQIIAMLPEYNHHISLFGGAAGEILYMPPAALETYNDLNGDLCNLFRQLREQASCQKLCRMVACTPHCRQEFEHARDILHSTCDDPLMRAWAVLVVGNQMRAGLDPTITHTRSWGYCSQPVVTHRWSRVPLFARRVGERFRDVQIENDTWESIFRRFDRPGVLFTADPPYPFGVRASNAHLYKYEMSDRDHERFLQTAVKLRGHCVIFSYDNPMYNHYLRNWRKTKIATKCNISPKRNKPPREEAVWMNFDPLGERIMFVARVSPSHPLMAAARAGTKERCRARKATRAER